MLYNAKYMGEKQKTKFQIANLINDDESGINEEKWKISIHSSQKSKKVRTCDRM